MTISKIIKKIAVLVPVLVLTVFFLGGRVFNEIHHSSEKRQLALAITVLLLYVWIIAGIIRRRQDSLLQMVLQSSFYVYLFMVLTLTGYFILFKEVSSHGWWDKVLERVHQKDKVNLRPFHVFKIYKWYNLQVVGNLIMLLPLAIYIPLLYRKIQGFWRVTFTCMLVSISIELMQLVTSYRITDIDDVILNTTGAALGYLIFEAVRRVAQSGNPPERTPL